MEVKRYRYSTYDELMEAEKKLHKETMWLNKSSNRLDFPIWKHLKNYTENPANDKQYLRNGAEMIKEIWKNPPFWHVPKSFLTIQFKKDFPGKYEFSLHARHNEDFLEFCKNDACQKSVKKLLTKPKPQLLQQKDEIRNQIDNLHTLFRGQLTLLQTRLKFFMEREAVDVKEYRPHSSCEEGRKTEHMMDLIERTELTYRGIMCGSVLAYETLLGNYTNDESVIDDLWELTSELVELNKEYLAVQMAIQHKVVTPGYSKDYDQLDEIVSELVKRKPKSSNEVEKIFKELVPNYPNRSHENYFKKNRKPNKSAFARSLQECYSLLNDDDTITPKMITERYSSDLNQLKIEE